MRVNGIITHVNYNAINDRTSTSQQLLDQSPSPLTSEQKKAIQAVLKDLKKDLLVLQEVDKQKQHQVERPLDESSICDDLEEVSLSIPNSELIKKVEGCITNLMARLNERPLKVRKFKGCFSCVVS